MYRPLVPPRAVSAPYDQFDLTKVSTVPRRPVGASLSNRSSRQTIDSLDSPDSTTDHILRSTRLASERSSDQFQSPTLVYETDPPTPDLGFVAKKGSNGYRSVVNDPERYEQDLEQEGRPLVDEYRSGHGYKWRRSYVYHLKAWWAEIAWCALATVLLAALVAILKNAENEPQQIWLEYITLNALVAFAATLCRAAMVIPISECISQLKWNSFASGNRSMMDLYAFDQASRGPYGSIMLLFRSRGRLLWVTTLAALVLISGLVTSPLTQQTIKYVPQSERAPMTATVKTTTELHDYTAEVQKALSHAALRAMFTDDYAAEPFKPEPHCPASDCQWKNFRSLDICVTTRNITEKISSVHATLDEYLNVPGNQNSNVNESSNITKITITKIAKWMTTTKDASNEHLWWGNAPDALDVNDDFAGWKPNAAAIPSKLLGGLYLVFVPPHAPDFVEEGIVKGLEAIQIIWHWCIKEYEVEVNDGVHHVNLVDTTELSNPHDEDLELSEEDENRVFRAPEYDSDFVGGALRGGRLSGNPPRNESNEIRQALIDIFYEDEKTGNWVTDWEGRRKKYENCKTTVEHLGHAIAVAMGNVLRGNGHYTIERRTHKGQAMIPTLVIRWQWLALLSAQLVCTVLLLAYVVVNTAKLDVEIVKSSNIAELLALNHVGHGSRMSVDCQEQSLPVGIRPDLDSDLQAQLTRTNGTWALNLKGRNDRRSGVWATALSKVKFWS